MRRSDAVITVGERLAKTLNKHRIDQVTVIGNWRSKAEYDYSQLDVAAVREDLGLGDYKLVVAYFGLFFRERSIEQILRAVSDLPDTALLIGGRGDLRSLVEDYAERFPNIYYFGWVSMTDIVQYNLISDAIFYVLDTSQTNQVHYSIPNKVFESLASGSVMIAVDGIGELSTLMERVGAADFIPDNSVESIRVALQRLHDREYLEELQSNALAARDLYTWEMAEERLAEIYGRLLPHVTIEHLRKTLLPPFIHASATIEDNVSIGDDTRIWHLVQVRPYAEIGAECNIGRGVYIDAHVKIGSRVKIQNYVSVYEGVTIEDGVFVGPHVVFTNDKIPRAINADGTAKAATDWVVTPTLIKYGAALGANSVIVCGVTVGRWALVGSGSVVTRDVPDYAIVVGNPARVVGYVDEAGNKIDKPPTS